MAQQVNIDTMRGKISPKVLVVGAGPCGLAAALTLNQRNIPIEVIERDDRPGTHSYALALHPATVAKLGRWGVAERLRGASVEVRKLVFCDYRESRFTLDLAKVKGQEAGLLVVGQDHLETALIAPLEQAGIPLNWNHRLASLNQTPEGVDVELERLSEGMSGYAMARLEWQVDKEVSGHAQYLIGADGHFSMVRRKLGIEFPKVAPTQSFAVFEFKTDYRHNNEARIVLGDEGASVLWPLPGGYCRWGFEIEETAAEQFSRDKDRLFMQVGSHGYHVLEAEMLEEMLHQRAPWFDGSVGQFRWRMIVRFEKRLADRFGNGRVWLAGDAGHLTGPIGMQSMNVGINEGELLGNIVADVIVGRTDPNALDAYAAGREKEWRSLAGLTARLVPEPDADPFMAANAARLISCVPASLESLPHFADALGMRLEPA
jgi:2-polyprenyl-6-methoxyphenol hydroxylase-like FAD-dependent oxidoreductase